MARAARGPPGSPGPPRPAPAARTHLGLRGAGPGRRAGGVRAASSAPGRPGAHSPRCGLGGPRAGALLRGWRRPRAAPGHPPGARGARSTAPSRLGRQARGPASSRALGSPQVRVPAVATPAADEQRQKHVSPLPARDAVLLAVMDCHEPGTHAAVHVWPPTEYPAVKNASERRVCWRQTRIRGRESQVWHQRPADRSPTMRTDTRVRCDASPRPHTRNSLPGYGKAKEASSPAVGPTAERRAPSYSQLRKRPGP